MANLIMNTSIQQWEAYLSSGGLLENNITLANESPGSLISSALDLLDENLDAVETGELNGEGTYYVHRLSTGDASEPVVIVTVTGSGFSPSTDPTRAGLINEDDTDFTINSFDVKFLETHSSTTPLAGLGFSGSLVVSNGELTSGSLTSFSMTALNGASFSITGDLNFNGVSLTSTAATLAWSVDTNPAEGTPSLATFQVKVANLVFNDTTEAGIITEIRFDDAYQDMHFALTGTAINFADLDLIDESNNSLESLINLAGAGAGGMVSASSDFILPTEFTNLILTGADSINGTGNSVNNILTGNNAANILSGLAGDDILGGGAGNDLLDGGEGIDTALFSGARMNYNISGTDSGFTVSDNHGTDGSDTLVSIERLQFSDAKIALDIDGNAGKVYRLYEAAFNRAPDKPGLAYWIWQADEGALFTEIASAFSGGIEFQNKYGSIDNNLFVEQLYQNILDRPGEAGGLAYWQWRLNDGHETREEILYGFSESHENQIGVIGLIENGIDYTT